MAYCKNCGAQFPGDSVFCQNCGQSVQEYSPTMQTPTYYENGNYGMNNVPVNEGKKKIPGRGFGIASLVLGIIGLLDSLYALMMSLVINFATSGIFEEMLRKSYNSSDLTGEISFDTFYNMFIGSLHTVAIFYSVIILVLGVLSLVFGLRAISKGYKKSISIAGVVLGGIATLFTVFEIIVSIA